MATLNIYQKLARIGESVEVLQKNTKGFNYTYVNEEDILVRIKSKMKELKISLVPQIHSGTTKVTPYHYQKTRSTKKGDIYEENVNEIIVQGEMSWIWINIDNPEERVEVPWFFVGSQSDPSQSYGSALTYASRYFLLKYFNVATSDSDPDEYRRKQKEAELEDGKVIATKIIEDLHEKVLAHLSTSDPEEREKVIAITKEYAKNAKGRATTNYFEIIDPITAAELSKALIKHMSGVAEK